MKKPKKRNLSTKMRIGLIMFALIILVFATVFVGIDSYYSESKDYSDIAISIASVASSFIDGDRVPDYLETVGTNAEGKSVFFRDEYYEEVQRYLDSFHNEFDLLKYYYVLVPYEDHITYVWDAASYYDQGFSEPYGKKDQREAILRAFSREPEETIILLNDEKWGNSANAYYPIFNSSGVPVAVVGAALSISGLEEIFLHTVLTIVGAIIVAVAIAFVIAYRSLNKMLIQPIEQLNEATTKLVDELGTGEHFNLDIHTGDELEELANNFRRMDSDLRDYIGQLSAVTTDRERIHAEFDIARQIQNSVIPHAYPAFPERTDFDIVGALNPSPNIGGDFFDFFLVDNDHLAMVAGDVSFTGVPAALYMIMTVTLVKNRAMQGFSPAEVLQSISEQMLEHKMEMFLTMWLAVLELSTGKGIAANAGYQHPALCRAGGKFEMQEYRHSPPIGALEGLRFRDHGFQLYPGDTLFIYSDGVRDAVNEQTEFFGKQRVIKALNQDPEATPSVLLQTVKADIDRFRGEMPQTDDLSMLCLKYYGSGSEKKMPLSLPEAELDEE